jgi:hypothetical protein
MFQPTQRRISEKFKSTLDSDALPFHEILDADMVESAIAFHPANKPPLAVTHRRKLVCKAVLVPVEPKPIVFLVDVHRYSPHVLRIQRQQFSALATSFSAR